MNSQALARRINAATVAHDDRATFRAWSPAASTRIVIEDAPASRFPFAFLVCTAVGASATAGFFAMTALVTVADSVSAAFALAGL
jgi:hypothetical protein